MTRTAALLLAFVLVGCNGSDTEPESTPEPDRLPVLTLVEPLPETVATPEVLVTASCTDDRGDCSLWVYADSQPVGEPGTNELSREFDLSPFNNQTVSLKVTAIDSTGQTRSQWRVVYVEGSPALANERAFPLPVVDFDGQRALLQREVDPIGSELTIVEVETGNVEHVDVPGLFVVEEAYLTPTGAAFAGLLEDDAGAPEAYDWNHALLVELGPPIQVAGDYATWVSASDGNLLRRQFSTMTDLHVRDSVAFGHSVASDGVVVFSELPAFEANAQIVKFDGTVYTTLTADTDKRNRDPRTDGEGVVYAKSDADVYAIALHDGTGETILTGPGRFPAPAPDRDYAIAGGWVAFIEFTDPIRTRVWTRDPSGTLLERAAFDGASRIETLAPDGEVMVVTEEARYLSRPTGELTPVSSETGQSRRVDEAWYVFIGRSVFEVQ